MATHSGQATGGSADAETTVRIETAVNTVATIVIAAAVSWLLFGGEAAVVALARPPGGIFGILPGTFNFTLLVTLVLTVVLRRRRARGRVGRASLDGAAVAGALPRHLLLRAVALALTATVLFVPATAALVWLAIARGVVAPAWSPGGMLAFYCSYFALLALAVTPSVVRRALAD